MACFVLFILDLFVIVLAVNIVFLLHFLINKAK